FLSPGDHPCPRDSRSLWLPRPRRRFRAPRAPGEGRVNGIEQVRMTPLARFPMAERARICAVLCDIDDTLTDRGRLPAASYRAMERLRKAGILVIPVTGRPAGWCDLIARQWP